MAHDEGLAQVLREDPAPEAMTGALTGRRMSGGLAFLRDGPMVCGVHKEIHRGFTGGSQRRRVLHIGAARPMARAASVWMMRQAPTTHCVRRCLHRRWPRGGALTPRDGAARKGRVRKAKPA